jgi:DNA-binding NarL/FixJ family response regulator
VVVPPCRCRSGTLHDSSLQLAYWLPEGNTFVDAAGAPVLVELARDRALTHLERDGETIADVTAEVGDAAALLDAVDRDPPDAVVVDIRMPPTHTTEGLEAARALAARHPEVGVLVLSAYVEPHYAMQLVESGATGTSYLLKERVADPGELADGVRRVAAGGVVIDPGVVAQLVGRRRVRNPLDALSDREREVLAVMAEGRSNQAICERLFLSPKTVEAYVHNVFTKLDLHQAADANRRVLAVLTYLRA